MIMAGTFPSVVVSYGYTRECNTRGIWHKIHTVNVLFDALVREDRTSIDVDLVSNSHIIPKDGNILQSCPSTHSAIPSDNRRLYPSVILHLAVLEQDAALKSYSIANNDIRPNHDIRSNTTVFPNRGRRVDQYISSINVWL